MALVTRMFIGSTSSGSGQSNNNIWRLSVKVGDMIRLQSGSRKHWDLQTGIVMLLEKLPRPDTMEYDWKALTETGRIIELGRQIEGSSEIISAS